MNAGLKKFLFILLASFLVTGHVSAYYNQGKPAGFVNDYTGTLSSEQKQQLEDKLSQFEKETSNEISIAIINDLRGDTIENFAVELFKEWGVGKEEKDNGILILVAKDDRKMRIEVGYGLEGVLTDAQSSWIISDIMKPAFKNNDFFKGLNEAVDKIIATTKGEYVPSASKNSIFNLGSDALETIFFFCFAGFMWLAAILGRSKSWWLGGVLGGVAGIVIGVIKGFLFFGLVSIVILVPLGLLFDFIISKQYKVAKTKGKVPWWIGGGGRNNGGFGGFGGGMSGGGGSSGGW